MRGVNLMTDEDGSPSWSPDQGNGVFAPSELSQGSNPSKGTSSEHVQLPLRKAKEAVIPIDDFAYFLLTRYEGVEEIRRYGRNIAGPLSLGRTFSSTSLVRSPSVSDLY